MKYETRKGRLERVRGLEPPLRAWKAIVLPLHHTRAEYPMPALSTLSQSLSFTPGPDGGPEGAGGPSSEFNQAGLQVESAIPLIEYFVS